MRRWGSIWLASACICGASLGCDRGATAGTPGQQVEASESHSGAAEQKDSRAAARKKSEPKGLIIGEFRLPDNPVIDGDTIRVEGFEDSIRLLSLDTEEKFHGRAERLAASKDFAQYLKNRRGDAARPQKTGTPMGEEASKFAATFFEGVKTVRLERDDPKETHGYFGRPLAYAFVKKNGRWTSYNVESVRAGMSPYFTKYGYSRRFHNQLTHAEAEARNAKRGIWDPSAQGYGDYDERKAWWNARADFIRAFDHDANSRDDFIQLSHSDALVRLEEKLGSRAIVLSTVGEIKHFKGLSRVSLEIRRDEVLPVIFFNRDVLHESGIEDFIGEPVTVRGTVERYEKGHYRTLQIVVEDPEQVGLPSLP